MTLEYSMKLLMFGKQNLICSNNLDQGSELWLRLLPRSL